MLISFLISIVALVFLLINSILFIKTSKGKGLTYKCLTIYLSVLFLVELVCNIIGFSKPNSNFFLSHYYFIFQFVGLSWFFYQLFEYKIIKSSILFIGIVVLGILGFQYYHNPNLYWEFNVLEIGLTSIILIIYSSIHFYKNLKTTYNYFYFCFGLTFYLMSSMLIFLSGNTNLVFFEKPFFFDIWIFNSLFYILYQYLVFKEWRILNKEKEEVL